MKRKIKEYFLVIIGLLIVAFTYDLFLSPNELAAGGVGGLAIIIKKIFGIEESLFIFLINIFLILLSYLCLGKEKTKNTILGSILLPIFIRLFKNAPLWFPMTIDPVLVAVIGGFLSGFGYGLIFRCNFTTGGTDILNQMMEKYAKVPMAKSIMYVDGCIVLLDCVVFGFTSMLYALIALYLISTISNQTQLGINKNRVFYITSKKLPQMKEYLTKHGYDVTILDTIGGYSKKKTKLILCSVHAKDYYKIKEGLILIDPLSFIIVANAYEELNANVMIRKKKLMGEKE